MSVTDELLANNERYAAKFDKADLPIPPGKSVAVVACMDARLQVSGVLGLEEGDAHVIRNAGGIVSTDALRSLVISQHLLGTTEVILIHHTDCGMLTFKDDDLYDRVEENVGSRPSASDFEAGAFADLEGDVRHSIETVRNYPFLLHTDSVRGFVYDVKTGKLNEVA
ncbi:MAG: beta-class carbonic anhydrase [Acidimicrobiales bacterium]